MPWILIALFFSCAYVCLCIYICVRGRTSAQAFKCVQNLFLRQSTTKIAHTASHTATQTATLAATHTSHLYIEKRGQATHRNLVELNLS